MARRKRKTKTRTIVRTVTKKASKRRRKSSSSMSGVTAMLIGGMAYGATRQWASDQLASLTKGTTMSWLGEYSDEVTMGALSYFLMKGKIPLLNKMKWTKEVGKAGLYIESARAGSQLLSGVVQSKAPKAASTNSFR